MEGVRKADDKPNIVESVLNHSPYFLHTFIGLQTTNWDTENFYFSICKFIMSNKDIRIKTYRSSIQKRVEELEVEKDYDDVIEKGWERAMKLYNTLRYIT